MKMNFNFHCVGMVSQEKMNVVYENEEVIVLCDGNNKLTEKEFEELDKSEHENDYGEEYWIFRKSSGSCINDFTAFGCKRTITV